MRVYVAAPYGARALVASYHGELERQGFTPASFWAYGQREINAGTVGVATALTDQQAAQYAADDLKDVASSDALVLLTASHVGEVVGGCHSGMRHVETGAAVVQGKLVVVIGEPENILHRSELVTRVKNFADALGVLRTHRGARPLSAWE